jgi:hypothetical protein
LADDYIGDAPDPVTNGMFCLATPQITINVRIEVIPNIFIHGTYQVGA